MKALYIPALPEILSCARNKPIPQPSWELGSLAGVLSARCSHTELMTNTLSRDLPTSSETN